MQNSKIKKALKIATSGAKLKKDDIHTFNESDEDNNYKEFKIQKGIIKNKVKVNLGEMVENLIKSSNTNKNPILSKFKIAEKKVNKEKKVVEDLLQKKRKTTFQRQLGLTQYDDWDEKKEKVFKRVANKGIVKLLNSIFEHKKKIKQEDAQKEVAKEKKSHNFLQLHDLNPDISTLTRTKKFKEDTLLTN